MRRCWIAIALAFCCAPPARAAQETAPKPDLHEYESNIRVGLEGHGERVLGPAAYHWSTRLEKIANCRAELKVTVTSNMGDPTVRTDRVSFSLGALDSRKLDVQKNWLVLPCAAREKCISTISSCTTTTKDGFVIDCTSMSQTRDDAYSLQLDGDAAASTRLKEAFHEAIDICRTPTGVTF
jgi:hypothetical protein